MVGTGVVTCCGLSAHEYAAPASDCPVSCCQPRLSLQPPAIEDLLLGSNANLTCTLSGLKEGQEATFTWKPSGGKAAIQGALQPDAFGCYSVSSVLPGCADPWNRGETFSCTATYSGSESNGPLTATIAKTLGARRPHHQAPHSSLQCERHSSPQPPPPRPWTLLPTSQGETEAQGVQQAKGLLPPHPDR